MNYRKRPVVIDAIQWDGTPATHFAINDRSFSGDAEVEWQDDGASLFIPTLEGIMEAKKGDWVIRGIAGEVYPCKPAIFNASYERADDVLTTDPRDEEIVDLLMKRSGAGPAPSFTVHL